MALGLTEISSLCCDESTKTSKCPNAWMNRLGQCRCQTFYGVAMCHIHIQRRPEATRNRELVRQRGTFPDSTWDHAPKSYPRLPEKKARLDTIDGSCGSNMIQCIEWFCNRLNKETCSPHHLVGYELLYNHPGVYTIYRLCNVQSILTKMN